MVSKGLSTDTCIFSPKQILDYYRLLSCSVYLGILDASKAFDKINAWTLGNCYQGVSGMLVIIVRILYVYNTIQWQFIEHNHSTKSLLLLDENIVRDSKR